MAKQKLSLTAQLQVDRRGQSAPNVVQAVPKVELLVIRCRCYKLHLSALDVDIVSSRKGTAVPSRFLRNVLPPLSSASVIDLKPASVSFHHNEVLQFLEIEHMFNLCVVLDVFDWTRLVVLDGIDRYSVLAHHTKLNDVVRELHPLQTLVVVDVDLSEKVHQLANHADLGSWVTLLTKVVFLGHDFDEGVEVEPAVATQYVVIVKDGLQLQIIKAVHQIFLFIVVSMLVPLFRLGHNLI